MNTKNFAHLAHYGSSFFLIGVALLTMLGVHFPGITVDSNTAMLAGFGGLGVLGAGVKSDLASN